MRDRRVTVRGACRSDDLMTVGETARLLRVSFTASLTAILTGDLPRVWRGGRPHVHRELLLHQLNPYRDQLTEPTRSHSA